MRNILAFTKKKQLETECLSNAKSLLREAAHMLRRKKYNLATFFAITSLEESQKLGLLSIYESKYITEAQLAEYWGKHIKKYQVPKARIHIYVSGSSEPTPELELGSLKEAEKTLKDRNRCLYVDFSENSIITPQDIDISKATEYYNEAKREFITAEFFYNLAAQLKENFQKIS